MSDNPQEKLEQLVNKIKAENERHKNHVQMEKERHKKAITSVKEEGGINSMIQHSKKIKEKKDRRIELREHIEDKLYTVMNEITRRKRHTISGQITIREGEVYQYGKSDLANLGALVKNKEEVKDFVKEDHQELYSKLVTHLEKLDLNTDRVKRSRYAYSSPNPVDAYYMLNNKVKGIDVVYYTTENTGHVHLLTESRYNSLKDQYNSKPSYSSKENLTSSREDVLEKLIHLQPYISDAMHKVEDKLDESIERRKQVNNDLKELTAEFLVAEKL